MGLTRLDTEDAREASGKPDVPWMLHGRPRAFQGSGQADNNSVRILESFSLSLIDVHVHTDILL
jgi:hypothetical protein